MPVVERMRPSLGTFVAIRAEAAADLASTQVQSAIDCAFHAIERVDQLMSFHRHSSDIGRLNRAPRGGRRRVHGWTYRVLCEAQRLWHGSGGAFDCNVGAPLARAGLLPKIVGARRRLRPGTAAIELRANRMVVLKARVALDLGGIAKGFAVDKAVEVLQAYGIKSGLVNAGGDLRVFGERPQSVWVRRPGNPNQVQLIGALVDGAMATSASYFINVTSSGEAAASAIVDPARGRRVSMTRSVSVIAKTCMMADALTKIAVLTGRLPVRFSRPTEAKIVML